jgi:molybdopterin synthase catalytic subunit
MTARLVREPIRPEETTAAVRSDGDGAVATFVGVVRDRARGRRVLRLEYHAHEPMAVREIERIEEEVRTRFEVSAVRIVHRIGTLAIGEVSVAIAVASPHRAAAFDGCRWAIERLKERVPIWKKEVYEDGEAWIEGS